MSKEWKKTKETKKTDLNTFRSFACGLFSESIGGKKKAIDTCLHFFCSSLSFRATSIEQYGACQKSSRTANKLLWFAWYWFDWGECVQFKITWIVFAYNSIYFFSIFFLDKFRKYVGQGSFISYPFWLVETWQKCVTWLRSYHHDNSHYKGKKKMTPLKRKVLLKNWSA